MKSGWKWAPKADWNSIVKGDFLQAEGFELLLVANWKLAEALEQD